MERFIHAASKEFGVRGINVNNVAPGPLVIKFSEGAEVDAPCPNIDAPQHYSALQSLVGSQFAELRTRR